MAVGGSETAMGMSSRRPEIAISKGKAAISKGEGETAMDMTSAVLEAPIDKDKAATRWDRKPSGAVLGKSRAAFLATIVVCHSANMIFLKFRIFVQICKIA